MELLIALMISLGAVTAEQGLELKGNEAKTVQMAEQAGIRKAKIEEAQFEIIGTEETDF